MSSAAAATADAPAPKKGGKKLLIIILAVVLLLVVAGGGAAFFLMKKKAGDDHEADHPKPAKKKDPSVFQPLDPFTVNLADPGREHYLQIGLTYEVATGDVGDALKQQMPLIRSRVLLLLTSKSSDELGSPQGKAKLAGDLVALARGALANSPAPGAQNAERGIVDVHFSSFIIH